MDLVLGGTAARCAAVGGRALSVFILCFGKGCSRIHFNFTSIRISCRNETVTRNQHQQNKKIKHSKFRRLGWRILSRVGIKRITFKLYYLKHISQYVNGCDLFEIYAFVCIDLSVQLYQNYLRKQVL